MPALGKLTPKTITSTFDLGGEEPARITYRPQQIVAVERALEETDEADTKEVRNVLAKQLAAVVVGWDVEGPVPDEDLDGFVTAKAGEIVAAGEVIPIDKDVLTWFPVPTLKALMQEIVEDSGNFTKETRNGSRPSG